LFLTFAAERYLLSSTIGGIEGVHQVCALGPNVLLMQGSQFRDMLNHPLVDFRQSLTTDLWQCLEVLGIEAARALLVQELASVYRAGGSDLVDTRHFMLLADTMTTKGTLKSVTRHGLDRIDVGPLAKASNEQMLDNFMQAAYRCERDTLTGVSGAIITGKCETFGSSTTSLHMSPGQRRAMSFSATGLGDRIVEHF
jgi:DNA-directed RNA polymerase II subunit RPB1